jgi:aryl-alcohol dehydrogenase-like predicted oxidoreductase
MIYKTFSEGPFCSGAKFSVLGFGCGALMGRVGSRDSMKALNTAYDAGITLYDTARSYGYGQSEGLLGEFLKNRRGTVILCTKFGILPSGRNTWKQKAKPFAQAAVRLFPNLRRYAQRHAATELVGGHFSAKALQESIETSLSQLQTDYVDMLLVHDANEDALRRDDLLQGLEILVSTGKVRMAGISGSQSVVADVLREPPSILKTAQFALNHTNLSFSVELNRLNHKRLLLVANHPFGGTTGAASTLQRLEQLLKSPALPPDLRVKTAGSDPRQLMPEILLNLILKGTGVSAVVPAMLQKSHLLMNVAAVENCRFTSEEIEFIRNDLMQPSLSTLSH